MMKAGTSTPSMPKEVERLVRDTVSRITTSGGRVVGLIGFSQGTKVVAGLLQGAQIRRELGSRGEDWLGKLQFGLCVCSSYAPPLLPPCVQHLPEFQRKEAAEQHELLQTKIALPMLHVQGEQDEWKWAGDGMIERFCEVGEGKCEVVAWDMGHHYPTKPEESEKMKSWLVEQLEAIDG
jgi:predicted esterase